MSCIHKCTKRRNTFGLKYLWDTGLCLARGLSLELILQGLLHGNGPPEPCWELPVPISQQDVVSFHSQTGFIPAELPAAAQGRVLPWGLLLWSELSCLLGSPGSCSHSGAKLQVQTSAWSLLTTEIWICGTTLWVSWCSLTSRFNLETPPKAAQGFPVSLSWVRLGNITFYRAQKCHCWEFSFDFHVSRCLSRVITDSPLDRLISNSCPAAEWIPEPSGRVPRALTAVARRGYSLWLCRDVFLLLKSRSMKQGDDVLCFPAQPWVTGVSQTRHVRSRIAQENPPALLWGFFTQSVLSTKLKIACIAMRSPSRKSLFVLLGSCLWLCHSAEIQLPGKIYIFGWKHISRGVCLLSSRYWIRHGASPISWLHLWKIVWLTLRGIIVCERNSKHALLEWILRK